MFIWKPLAADDECVACEQRRSDLFHMADRSPFKSTPPSKYGTNVKTETE